MRKYLGHTLAVLFLISAAAAQTSVEGIVQDSSGKAVSAATVVLQRAEGSIAQKSSSDAAGRFRFSAVDADAYTLKTEAGGFYPSSYAFVLRPRQPATLTIELQKKEAVKQT